MPIIFQQNSLYNYGGISPNNLVSYIATYNPAYYYSTGGYFGTGTTVYDLTSNKNNFTLVNSYSYSGGISFSGTNGYIVSGNLITYFPSFNRQTQELWFKNSYYNESGTNGVLLNEWGVNTPDTNWYYSQMEIVGGTGYIGIYNNLGLSRLPVGRFTDGLWHCMSWRYDGSTLSGFMDGVKTATGSFGRLTPSNFYVGIAAKDITNMGNGGYFKGLIGSYRLYNRDLTDNEILQNYNYEKQFFRRSVRVNVIGPSEVASWYADIINKITSGKNSAYPEVQLTITQTNNSAYSGSDLSTSLYDCVFIFADASYSNASLGTNLNNYVSSGGGLVIAVFAIASVRITNFTYTNCPVAFPGNQTMSSTSLGTYTSSDPIMKGVSSFNPGSSRYGAGSLTLNPGATTVASYNDSNILVAKQTIGSARTVALNFFPPSTTARSDFWSASTDGDKLMSNSIIWSGKGV